MTLTDEQRNKVAEDHGFVVLERIAAQLRATGRADVAGRVDLAARIFRSCLSAQTEGRPEAPIDDDRKLMADIAKVVNLVKPCDSHQFIRDIIKLCYSHFQTKGKPVLLNSHATLLKALGWKESSDADMAVTMLNAAVRLERLQASQQTQQPRRHLEQD